MGIRALRRLTAAAAALRRAAHRGLWGSIKLGFYRGLDGCKRLWGHMVYIAILCRRALQTLSKATVAGSQEKLLMIIAAVIALQKSRLW